MSPSPSATLRRTPSLPTTTISPPRAPLRVWWTTATRCPSGEMRRSPIQPPVSNTVWPTGNSSRCTPLVSGTTANTLPSDDQSAAHASSYTSRGMPPASGTRASVVESVCGRGRSSATSPPTTPATTPAAASGRDSAEPSCSACTSSGRPSQRAP